MTCGVNMKLMEFDINSGQSFVVFKATSYIRSEINTYWKRFKTNIDIKLNHHDE